VKGDGAKADNSLPFVIFELFVAAFMKNATSLDMVLERTDVSEKSNASIIWVILFALIM
jgi:hypothetical protein